MFLLAAQFSHPERLILCFLILACTAAYPAATTNTSFTGTKSGCQSQCGNLTVPYPFGIGSGCSMDSYGFDIHCNVSENTTKAFMGSGYKEVLSISETQVRIGSHVSYACYDAAGNITLEHTAWIQLGNLSRFTFSQTANKFMVVGCDDAALFSNFRGSDSIGGCITLCSQEKDVRAGPCNGLGCSQTSFPEGLKSFYARLISFDKHVKVNGFDSCGYAFLGEEARFNFNGSVDLWKDPVSFSKEIRETVPIVLDWTAGDGTCYESKNHSSFACQGNTFCVDVEPGHGYRCRCLDGYEGNPYLKPGCTDINECASTDTNGCVDQTLCINTPGSYYCFCPDAQFGDGFVHGFGCMKGHTKTPTKIIVGAVLGGSLGMMVMLLSLYWLYQVLKRRRQTLQKAKYYKQNGGLLLEQRIAAKKDAVEGTIIFSSEELEKATDHFNADRILGQGGQGTVYKGMLTDGRIVAIKKSKKVDENQREQFINEVYIMSQINHRNIVKLLGCCLETEVPLLVYEFVPNGTLYHHIHFPSDEFHITWEMRLQIATNSAAALAYLHSDSSFPVYHRDIKSANILLDEKYRAKVSDFGISRSISIDQTHVTTRVIGTPGYLDPEYHQSNQYTEKSDVYSFGVVLVELITGQKVNLPPGSQRNASLASLFLSSIKDSSILDIIDPGVLKEGRKEEILLVADLAKRCLNLDGKQRPTMRDVATELNAAMSHDGALLYHQKLLQAQTNLMEIQILDNSYNDFSTTSTSSTGIIASKPIDTVPLLFDTTENSASSFL
ncbi:Wall-associated receptor kinase 5-like protein [Drosera capensis]